MASEIFNLNTLDKLQKRVVRGARVSFKNASFSGNVVIFASETTNPFYEYLVEISTSGDIPMAQYVFIRNTYTYNIDGSRENYITEYFRYDKTRSSWVKDNPVVSSPVFTSSSFVTVQDDVQVKFLPSVQADKNDFTYIGSIPSSNPKILVNKSEEELTDLSISPIPYPADHSTLVVKSTPLLGSPVTLVYGEDFVVNYSQNPTFTYPLPPFSDRTVAFLKFLSSMSEDQLTISSSFLGYFNINKGTDPIQNILPYGEVVSVGSGVKQKNFEYVIDYQTGAVNFTKNIDGEKLVNYVFYSDLIFDDDIVLIKGSGDVNNPVFLDANRLVGGSDYLLNETTGTLVFTVPLSPIDSVKASYFVEGEAVSGDTAERKKLAAGEDSLRTEKFPILDHSVSITSLVGTNTQKVLIEEEDYTISYKTGKITFLKDFVNVTFTIEYTPLAFITCILKPSESDPNLLKITIENDPIQVVDGSQYRFKVLNPNVSVKKEDNLDTSVFEYIGSLDSLGKISLKDPISGSEINYDVSGFVYTDSDRFIKLKTNAQASKPLLGQNSLVVATYAYTDSKLPYAPITASSMVITQGSSIFKVQGKDRTDVLMPGSLVRLQDKVSDSFFYFILNSVVFNGTDTVCAILGSFPLEIKNPSFFISDSEVTFLPSVEFSAMGAKSDLVVFNGDFSGAVGVGSILKINGEFIHSITSVNVSNGITILGVVPSLYVPLSTTDTLLVSDYPIFLSGETVVSARNFILSEPSQPVFGIYYTGVSGSAFVSLLSSILKVRLVVGSVSTETSITISTYPLVKNLVTFLGTYLNTFFSTSSFSVILFSTDLNVTWKTNNIIEFSETLAPYSFTINPDVVLNGNQLPFEESLGETTSFEIENGSVVLSRGLKRNDKVVATYQGRDSLQSNIGDIVSVECKYFTSLLKGTKITASMDYLNPDQFFVETLREDDYVSNIFFKEIENQISQMSGQIGGGVEGSDDAPDGNSIGGGENNYYKLREQEIRIPLFKKIYDYYKNRIKYFGVEVKNLLGYKLGNNDVVLSESDPRYSFIKETDLDNALISDFSSVYPEGYRSNSPLFSVRFSQEVPSYIPALFKNESGVGKAFISTTEEPNSYSGWLEILSVGDQVKIDGREGYLTISAIQDSGKRLIFSSSILNLQDGDYGFSIKFSQKPKFPLWDDSLYIGAKAISQESIYGTSTLSFGTFRNFVVGTSDTLRVVASLADGSSQTINVINSTKRKTIDAVVDWLASDATLVNYFRITKERAYGVLGARDAVVFRGHLKDIGSYKQVVSFQFKDGTGFLVAKNLGFMIDTDYLPYYTPINVNTYLGSEVTLEQSQSSIFETIQDVYNKFYRYHSSYKSILVSNSSSIGTVLDNTKPLVTDSIVQGNLVLVETDASPEIIISNTQTTTAVSTYTSFNTAIDSQSAINSAYANILSGTGSTPETFILSFEQKTMSRLDAQSSISSNLPSLSLSAQGVVAGSEPTGDDARIVFGDKTTTTSIPLDGESYFVFPRYVSGTMVGTVPFGFDLNLQGSWASSVSSETVMLLSKETLSLDTFLYSVNEISLVLFRSGSINVTYTFLFSDHQTVGNLVSLINSSPYSSSFSASVYGANSSFPSSGLKISTNSVVGTSTTVNSAELLYSPSSSFNFTMGIALNISSTGVNPKYLITDTSITLSTDSSSTTILFSLFPNISLLISKINTVTNFSATVGGVSTAYAYGTLGIKSLTNIVGTMPVYLGAKGDITYYQISSKRMNAKKAQNNSRISEINTFITFIEDTRFSQIEASVSSEKLAEKWSLWLGFRMNKETGCNYQRKYITDQIAKNSATLSQLQSL